MSNISSRKRKTSAHYEVQALAREDVVHFPLAGLLPENHVLVLNLTLGTLSHLAYILDSPRMLAEEQFTHSELALLMPLLKSFPHYCPYEVLLANFQSGNMNESTIARWRERIHDARLTGIWDQEMRPARNMLSRARLKLHAFGLDILSIFETGYIIMPIQSHLRLREA
jgi:hypothetical protein